MKSKIILFLFFANVLSASAQNKTTFGLQYKPIIPAAYFNSSDVSKSSEEYSFNLTPKYSNSFGMVIRQKINATFSIESGLNYIQRNFSLTINRTDSININDKTEFGLRSYELPLQLLAYVQTSEHWFVNASFGFSYNTLASDAISKGIENDSFYQYTMRRRGGYVALLTNVGLEYRTEKNGNYYLGVSLHRPFKEIAYVFPEHKIEVGVTNINDEFNIKVLGNFISIDLRYFFAE
jgi:hypothetical protein